MTTPPINFGDKQYNYGVGYPTPFSIPDETVCRTFQIPAAEDNADWLAVFMGALYALTFPEAWQQFEGAISREDAAQRWADMLDQAYADAEFGCTTGVPTPYWDDSEDLDDEEPADMQPWYGYVTNPTDPPDELSFQAQASIWLVTGFLALATWEVGFAPAVFFHTIAGKFALAFERGDIGSIIRIVIDSVEYGRVDTTDASPGDIIRVTVAPGDDMDGHDILIVEESETA